MPETRCLTKKTGYEMPATQGKESHSLPNVFEQHMGIVPETDKLKSYV